MPKQFEPGQRVRGDGQSIYQMGANRECTPWWHLHSGRKVFFNYRYHERELYEAAEDEWLDVHVRGVGDFCDGSGASIDSLRDRLRFEATEVLARQSTWFPEPLDLIDVPPGESQDDGGGALLLVTSDPHGQTLGDWAIATAGYVPWKFAVCLEILEVLESLHRAGLVLGAFGPDDFVIDENSRLFCVAADRVLRADSSGSLRSLYPPERYPLGHAAPEVRSATSAFDARADLYAWASLSSALVSTGAVPESTDKSDDSTAEDAEPVDPFVRALRKAAEERPEVLRGLSPKLANSSPAALCSEWMKSIKACLSHDPETRPSSVQSLQKLAGARTKKTSVRKLLSQWLGE